MLRVRTCMCVRLTVVAKLSDSCDNGSQMFESTSVVMQHLNGGFSCQNTFTCRNHAKANRILNTADNKTFNETFLW